MFRKRPGRIVVIEARSPRPHVFSKARLPRLGAVLLGTILNRQGWDVTIFIEDIAAIDWSVALEADVAAISTITSTAPRAYWLADRFREAGIPVVLGGAHPTFCPDEALTHADFVVRGEGEAAIIPLVEAIRAGKEPGPLPGLSRRDKMGRTVHNPLAPFLSNLDANPIPDYTLVHGHRGVSHVVSIATSRGCPFDCHFCSVIQMFGRRYRFHSADRVLEEIRRNAARSRHIFFCDDNFCANPGRTKQILRRVRDGEVMRSLEWSAQVRVEAARDTELLELMAATGCYGVYIGLESVNERTLKLFNKKQNVAQIISAIERFHAYGIHVHGMFVLGSDEDDVETIHQTMLFSRRMNIDSVQFLILTPLPGTQTFRELEAAGRLLHREWEHYDGANVVFEPRKMTAYELQREALKAHKDFYSLRSVVQSVLHGDGSYALIRYYARRQTRKTTKAVRPYTHWLRRQATATVSLGADAQQAIRRLKSLGIVADWLDARTQKVLTAFLNNLGIKTVVTQTAPAGIPATSTIPPDMNSTGWVAQQQAVIEKHLNAAIIALREGVDGILVPVNSTVKQQLEAINQRGQSIRQWLHQNMHLQNRPCLMPDIDREEIYKTCVQIGLALDLRLGTIRRAYRNALRSLENSGVTSTA